MKFVTMVGPKKSVIKEIEKPKINDEQILVKIKYVGVCMSEHYDWANAEAGMAFGHEPMGVIEQVGKNIKGFKAGDRISGLFGSSLPGTGGMVEYMAIDPASSVIVKLPDNLRDEDCILEPLACMMSAVSKAKVSMPGTEVAVVGCGYMGCGLISLLKMRGAYVVAIDIRKECLVNAKKYGADETYLVDEAKAKYLNGSFVGFKVVMEWAETNESLDLAINLTRECGQLCVGAYHTGPKRLINLQMLGVRAIEMLNTHPREWNLSAEGAANAAKMLSTGVWNYNHLPIKVYPMGKFDQAHAELETKYGKYMKAIIDMTKTDGEPYII